VSESYDFGTLCAFLDSVHIVLYVEVAGAELSCGLRDPGEKWWIMRWLGFMMHCVGFLEVDALNWCVKDPFFISE
jgi:hypothetical protein